MNYEQSKSANMADLSDAELVAELNSFGENVSLPLKAKQKPILVKKLNHLRVRHRKQNEIDKSTAVQSRKRPTPSSQAVQGGSGSRYRPNVSTSSRSGRPLANLDTLSSDDSDVEQAPDVKPIEDSPPSTSRSSTRLRNNQLSDSVLRTLRRRTGDNRTNDILDHSPAGNKRKGIKSVNNGEARSVPSPARSKLYPDLSSFTPSPSRNDDNFESSDSDGEQGSSYFVENKSINTSFASQIGDSSIGSLNHHHQRRSGGGGGSYFPSSSNSSPSLASSSFSHNSRFSGYGSGGVGRHRESSRIQPYKSRFSDFLPKLLIGLFVIFLAVVSVTYVVIHKDFFFSWFSHSGNVGYNDNLLHCKDGVVHKDCFEESEIQRSLPYIQKLYEELSVRKGRVLCEQDVEGSDRISSFILRSKIKTASLSETQSSRLFDCCVQHILVNPHWNLKVFRQDGSIAQTVGEVAHFESSVASMTFWCRLRRSFETVVYGLFLIASVIGVALLLSFYVKYRIRANEKEQADIYLMVEKIIEYLQDHHDQTKGEDSDETPYVAVQHVRDQLLAPAQRHQLQHTWNKAVTFIAANESRIRQETKIIRGEEFDVWHWLQPVHNNGKIWQGLAFVENSPSNEINYSPSPCLKIRNMFDSAVESDDDWEEGVVDAILEKCSHIPSIVHIHVDTNSTEGCVYLKCSSCDAAGKVRKALNSWWFDGRLVTVKFLKADYYHKRWPASRSATRPMKPSTNLMRSMSQQMYRSSLEMT